MFVLLYGLVFLLWILQIALTYQTRFLYRYEDVGINVLPVVWFTEREIFAVSTNFGWYALLHLIYSLFGFSINTVQILRQVIQLFSLLSIAILLVRYLGYKKSFIPLFTIGLSPTFTYFVTSSAPYGIELQLLPIILLIFDSLNFKSKLSFLFEGVFWFLVMFGMLSYATFNIFLPALASLYWLKLRQYKHYNSYKQSLRSKDLKFYIKHILVSATAFLIPLIAGLLYYKHPLRLLYDPDSQLGTIFRSSSAFVLDGRMFMDNLRGIFNDLFNHGYSYYYQLQNGEFTHLFPVVPLIFVIFFSIRLLRKPSSTTQISLNSIIKICLFTIVANFLLTSVSYDLAHLPGIRRFTGALAAYYILFVICWNKVIHRPFKKRITNYLMIGILLLLPLHHLLVLPDNFRHLSDKSIFSNDGRIELAETPQSYLKSQLDSLIKEDLYLQCPKIQTKDEINILAICPYQNIFATLTASCMYNKLPCHNIYGFEPYTEQFIHLTFDLFLNGTYPHLH